MDDRKNKIFGSMFGGAIGDALGYQIEFKRNIKEKEVTKYNDIGIISDDTQMTLFTANALIWQKTRGMLRGISINPVDAIYESYKDWLDTQTNTRGEKSISWIKDIKELNERRAPGNTCISALSSGIKGSIDNPINDSKGCGSIMRAAPIGLYIDNSLLAGEVGALSSCLTHGHPLGIIPTYIFTTMINLILNKNLEIEDALNNALRQYKENFDKFDKENTDYFFELVKKAVRLSKENKSDLESIKELGEGWVCEEAFAIAIYSCLKHKDSFQDTIICAVNHDGDSDSTGSIAGNIIGAYLGYDKIPNYYIDNLELGSVIEEISNDLSSKVPIRDNSCYDQLWLNKYVYCKKISK